MAAIENRVYLGNVTGAALVKPHVTDQYIARAEREIVLKTVRTQVEVRSFTRLKALLMSL